MKTDGLSDAEVDQRHAENMAKKKATRDKIIATKTIEKGMLNVHTRKGKGKSTVAFGTVMSALGHGLKVGVVVFMHGKLEKRKRGVLERFADQVTIRTMGEGFTWETQDRQRDIAAAQGAWAQAAAMLADPSYRMVLLDELNIVLRYDYLEMAPIFEALANRPADQHVLITGRNAKDALIEAADMVTEMTMVKHPFRSGVKAQAGVEF